jgi:hypothetical protein
MLGTEIQHGLMYFNSENLWKNLLSAHVNEFHTF